MDLVCFKALDVSIPFIAGQWSLPFGREKEKFFSLICFNPLHCGAVVASLRASLPV